MSNDASQFGISQYKPTEPPFKLDIAAFWIIPDAAAKSGHRTIPIPDEVFAAYLDTLSD